MKSTDVTYTNKFNLMERWGEDVRFSRDLKGEGGMVVELRKRKRRDGIEFTIDRFDTHHGILFVACMHA